LGAGRRTPGLAGLLRIGLFGILRHLAGRAVRVLGGPVLDLVAGILADLGLGPVPLRLLLRLALALLLLLVGFLVLVVLLVLGVEGGFVGHVEGGEQLADAAGEIALVLDVAQEPVEVLARPVLDEAAPEIHDLGGGLGRPLAGEALAHHEGERVLEGGVGPVGDVLVPAAAMVAVLQHGRDVGGHPRHAARADGLDAGLLHRVEHGPGRLPLGGEPPVQGGIVAGQPQGHGIGVAPQDRHVLQGQPPGRLGQAGLVLAHEGRAVGREGHLQVGLAGDGLHGAGDGALQRLRRRFLLVARLAVRDGHLVSPVIPASCHPRGGGDP
jgi:hypothetical protein